MFGGAPPGRISPCVVSFRDTVNSKPSATVTRSTAPSKSAFVICFGFLSSDGSAFFSVPSSFNEYVTR
jgi:hypothetical protein